MMQTFLTADRVEIANFFKFMDLAFQGMVSSSGVPKPAYHAVEMYSRHFGDQLVETAADGERFSTKAVGMVDARRDVPYLSSVASLSADGSRLHVISVNKDFRRSMSARVRIQGFAPRRQARLWTLTAPSLDANNGDDLPKIPGFKWPSAAKAPNGSMFDAGAPGVVSIRESDFSGVSNDFEIALPPISVTSLEIERERARSK